MSGWSAAVYASSGLQTGVPRWLRSRRHVVDWRGEDSRQLFPDSRLIRGRAIPGPGNRPVEGWSLSGAERGTCGLPTTSDFLLHGLPLGAVA